MDRMTDDPKAPDTRRITFGFVIAWAWAVLVGIPGIMMLFEDKAGAGVCLILGALVALPPANAYAAGHWRLALSGWLRFVIVIALAGVAGSPLGAPQPVRIIARSAKRGLAVNAGCGSEDFARHRWRRYQDHREVHDAGRLGSALFL